MKKWLFFLFFECMLSFASKAQVGKDPSPVQMAISQVRSEYMQIMGPNSSFYNGNVYEHYWNTIAGHPFFLTDQFQKGTVQYENGLYQDIPLQYDMHLDILVSRTFSNDVNLQLVSEKVRAFTIGDHSFVRVSNDSLNSGFMHTGFYEELYKGAISVLVKRDNKIIRSLKTDELSEKFKEYDDYFILDAKGYHPVQSENQLISLLSDRKSDIKKFLNRGDMRFNKDPAKTIVQTIVYYGQLKNNNAE